MTTGHLHNAVCKFSVVNQLGAVLRPHLNELVEKAPDLLGLLGCA